MGIRVRTKAIKFRKEDRMISCPFGRYLQEAHAMLTDFLLSISGCLLDKFLDYDILTPGTWSLCLQMSSGAKLSRNMYTMIYNVVAFYK